MILTFIFGMAAAVLSGMAEPQLREAMGKAGLDGLRLTETEVKLVAYTGCLLIAALLSALIGSGGGVALMLGALVGVMLPRLFGG